MNTTTALRATAVTLTAAYSAECEPVTERAGPSVRLRYVVLNAVTGRLSPGLLEGLTERERGVLRLVGSGLSNAEIARELVLGEATVKTHVGNIFAKCELRDRAQAVVLSYESGLVRPGA